MAEGDERPPKPPDWRLYAAHHAVLLAQDVHDLDAGLEHALRVVWRELEYALHRRPHPVERSAPARPATPVPKPASHSEPVPGASRSLPRIRDDRLRALAQTAVAQGFDWKVDGGQHLRFTAPDGKTFTLSTTALGSAARSYKNARAAAKRAGVVTA